MQTNELNQVMILSNEKLDECPTEIKILPIGHVSSEKGSFLVDQESYKLMKTEMERRGIDIVIDYEHQTLKDIEAPAGGWVKEIEYTPEAIVAKVEWTSKAKEYLKNKEYRYLSPVILCRKSDGKAAILHSLALTNTPAINGMFAIVNSIDIKKDNIDKEETGGTKVELLEKMIKLLGLPEDATEEQVMQKLAEIEAKKSEEKKEESKLPKGEEIEVDKKPEETTMVANSVILGLLGLPEDAKTEDVTSKIMILKNGGQTTNEKMEQMLKRLEEREAEDVVMLAMKAGKITAAQKVWAKEYALKDRKGFDAFVEKAPAVVSFGKIGAVDAPKKENLQVDPMILKATGLTEADIKKYANMEEM